MGTGAPQFRYRAFISYSHADRALVDRLHRALETYRLPPRLVGSPGPFGPVPARLAPIFRDRDELPASGSLSAELHAALAHSLFLLVICSPAAARSRWVNEEVRKFKALNGPAGEGRVLALIVDGDPADTGEGGCFPPALMFAANPDGSLSGQRAEPVAADVRPGGDGWRLARLKLVAGLAGVPLDALVQREAQRRQRRAALVSGASLALAAVMAVLAVLAVRGQREAERQRAEADGLVEYMLTDLRTRLEPVGRLDVLDSVGQQALAYYQRQNLAALDPDALGRRARALHLVGEVRDLRGDSEGALRAFREAGRATGEQLARAPDDPDRMFDHAQSVFWVGQLAWQLRDWETAEANFRRYAELADSMLATDPGNAKWLAEVGYAANSLGALYLDRRRPADAIVHFRRYVAASARRAAAAPEDADAGWEASEARAWLADAHYFAGDLPAARAEREAQLAMLTAMAAADPRNTTVALSLARAHEALARIGLAEGDTNGATERARIARETAQALVAQDPANSLWREIAVSAANTHAEALLLDGRWAEAEAANRAALAGAAGLVAVDPGNGSWRIGLLMPARWMEAAILHGRGQGAAARAAIARFHAQFGETRTADLARGGQNSWLAIHAMEAADLAARGELAAARRVAGGAALIAMPPHGPQQQALNRQLAALASGGEWPADGAPGYPAARLIRAVAS